jgi:hypothetical protein
MLWVIGALLALLAISEVGLAATAATEFGPWHLLWAVPVLLAFDIFIVYEIDRMSRA